MAKFLIWVPEWLLVNDCSHDDGNKRAKETQDKFRYSNAEL